MPMIAWHAWWEHFEVTACDKFDVIDGRSIRSRLPMIEDALFV